MKHQIIPVRFDQKNEEKLHFIISFQPQIQFRVRFCHTPAYLRLPRALRGERCVCVGEYEVVGAEHTDSRVQTTTAHRCNAIGRWAVRTRVPCMQTYTYLLA